MALEFSEEITSGVAVTEVPEDVAEALRDAHAHLAKLPANRQLASRFPTQQDANLFVRQGKSWALANGLVFSRRGTVKDDPTKVSFRIYTPREKTEEGDAE